VYRTPDPTPHCVSCGSASVTPPTTFGADAPVSVFFASREGHNERFHVDRARVCLDCGYVMPAVSPETLTLMRVLLPALRPI